MRRRIRRRRVRFGRRRSVLKPILGWVLAAALIIPGGFFGAKLLFGGTKDLPTVTPDTPATTTQAISGTTIPTTVPPISNTQPLRGVLWSLDMLRDKAKLTDAAKKAVEAGYNCAVIELKDKDGNVYYASATDVGKKAQTATVDALPLETVTNAFTVMREQGLLPIPLLYAFEDRLAPRNLPEAKVTTTGHNEWTWYDGDPQNGGRPWLNPYKDAAQTYITALAEELQTAGAGAVMLDGVYFPTQTSQADFTTGGDATLSKSAVLQRFMDRMDAVCDIPVLLRCSLNTALGNHTAGYHINPLLLGADAVVPDMRVEALGDRVSVQQEMVTVSAGEMAQLVPRFTAAVESRKATIEAASDLQIAPLLGGDNVSGQTEALLNADKNVSFFVLEAP